LRALVTGGTGFIGANLVRRLLADGEDVHLVIRSPARTWRLEGIEDRLTNHVTELENTDAVRALATALRPDVIFHLAVHGAYSFETDRIQMVRSNVLGTANVIEAALASDCPVVVNTGSSSEYGDCDHAPSEDEAPRPNSDYAVTKTASTWLAQRAAADGRLRAPTLRLYSVYGPWEDPRRLMPQLVAHALMKTWPSLGPPWIVRDFVHVDDVVEAYRLAAQRPGSEPGAIYNVGTGLQTSLEQLTAVVGPLFGIEDPPRWGSHEPRAWDVRTWVADPRKIERELGWRAGHDLAAGITQMAEWMRPRLADFQLSRR
jgi:nucleoside-diphosphate-sugar epimerase